MLTMILAALLAHASVSTSTDCVAIDLSSNGTLREAQQRARAAVASSPAKCATVNLGSRTYHVSATTSLVLTDADSHVSWIGARGANNTAAEVTAAIDVPASSWIIKNAILGQLDISNLVMPSEYGNVTKPAHLKLLVKIRGVWLPMVLARWPNIPFHFVDVPPVNWTTISPTTPTCATDCPSFVWANDTDRPSRWAAAASEGRLAIHGFFKYLWRDARATIRKIDVTKRELSTGGPTISSSGVTDGGLWYAYNLEEELVS
jgi:hypothetical protein